MHCSNFLSLCFLMIILFIINENAISKIANPHLLSKERYGQACSKCHPTDPHEAYDALIDPYGLRQMCTSCHDNIPTSCKKAASLYVTTILKKQIPHLALTTIKGSLSCDSCHIIHGERDGEKKMKNNYFLFLKQAEEINPHKSGIFCIFCHNKEPLSAQYPLNLKYEGDRVLVCTQCHNNKRARADNHPVNIKPSKGIGVTLDEIFPLFEGKVTCMTCHDMKCQGGEKNPKFLRGGPYKTRIDTCLVCHKKDTYKAVNPHEQFDEHGGHRKDRCQYCHIIDMRDTSKD